MTPTDAFPQLPGIDTVEGLKRMLNKPALYEKVLRDFHSRFVGEAQTLRDLIQAGDYAGAERQAHSTKGLAGTIGAVALHDAAMALEIALRQGTPPSADEFATFERELTQVNDGIAHHFTLTG